MGNILMILIGSKNVHKNGRMTEASMFASLTFWSKCCCCARKKCCQTCCCSMGAKFHFFYLIWLITPSGQIHCWFCAWFFSHACPLLHPDNALHTAVKIVYQWTEYVNAMPSLLALRSPPSSPFLEASFLVHLSCSLTTSNTKTKSVIECPENKTMFECF